MNYLFPKSSFPRLLLLPCHTPNTFSAHLSPASGAEKAMGRPGGAHGRNGDTPRETGGTSMETGGHPHGNGGTPPWKRGQPHRTGGVPMETGTGLGKLGQPHGTGARPRKGEPPRARSSPMERRRPGRTGAPSGPPPPLCAPAAPAGHGPALPASQTPPRGTGPGGRSRSVPRARGGSGGHDRGGPSGPAPARPLAAPPRSPHVVTTAVGGAPRASRRRPRRPYGAFTFLVRHGGVLGGAGWAKRAGGSGAPCSDPSGRGSVYCFLPPLRAAPGAAHPFARQRRPISARRREAPANRRRARGRRRVRARRSRGRAPRGSRHFPERPRRALKGAAPRAEAAGVSVRFRSRSRSPVWKNRWLRLLRSPQTWAERMGQHWAGAVRVWAEASFQGRPDTIGDPRRC